MPIFASNKAERDALTSAEIIAAAKAGNERFRSGQRMERDFLGDLRRTAGGQAPVAVVLGCIDSRAPAEIVFDIGLGEVFNCRVAGNVDTPDMLGSIEFATKLAGAKVVVVLGHSACEAVKGAISGVRLGAIAHILDKVRPAIEATPCSGDRSTANPAFVNAVARKNVELTVERIRGESPVIAALEKAGGVRVVGCFFDLATGAAEFLEDTPGVRG